MEDKIFIDTGAYFAQFYKNDRNSKAVSQIWNLLSEQSITMVTTNHVLDELATLLARKTSYEFSSDRMNHVYRSDVLIDRPDEVDEKEALKYFEKYSDQKISFTDCLSFVVMKRLKIKRAFTSDKKHFEYAGFEVVPPLYS